MLKPVGEQREGAKVSKEYDEPRTPFERALAAGVVGGEARAGFEAAPGERGPLALKRALDAECEALWALPARRRTRPAATATVAAG